MKKHVREFLEQEEVGAARSKEQKRAARNRRVQRFIDWLTKKAESIEANGNPAAAAEFRATWSRISNGRYAKAFGASTVRASQTASEDGR